MEFLEEYNELFVKSLEKLEEAKRKRKKSLKQKQAERDRKSLKVYGVKWRTTRSGRKIGINKKGKVVKGNPHVLKFIMAKSKRRG
jgi:hypothetical protein